MKGYPNAPRTWRDYQQNHRKGLQKKALVRRLPWLGLCGLGFALVLGIVGYSGTWISAHLNQPSVFFEGNPEPETRGPEKITRADLPLFLQDLDFSLPPFSDHYSLTINGAKLSVDTSLDPSLQGYVHDLLRRSSTVRAAMVVLDPATGRILAMVDYRNGGAEDGGNLCLQAQYPAASLFKIIAAAAAMEAKGLTPETTLAFRGRRYTLYRSQLQPAEGRSATRLTLREAFSASINPVFGKLGIHQLGKEIVSDYAERFLFNQSIPFDLPLAVSPIQVPEDDFGLAEIASGYNKKTMISPVHAALLAAAVANGGTIMEPWLVQTVRDENGQVLYNVEPSRLASPIRAETARKMRALMDETVVTGTARSAFRPIQGRKTFRSIELGAKTGSINDPVDQHRVDWITAYAMPEGEGRGICVAGLAVHGEKSGVRAKDMVRAVIERHFSH